MFGDLGSPKYNEYCRDIHESGTYLLGVINDVLDMSRMEAGRLSIAVEPLDLAELIAESIRVVSAQWHTRRIAVTADIQPDLRIAADRRAVKQILLNVLSNAFKFTHEDGLVEVRARLVGKRVTITIKDNGIGIPSEAIAKLGRPFEQVQNQFTKNHKGSGLGLAITRSLTELHGGAIRISSREDQGTIVAIRIPIGEPVAIHRSAA